MNRLSKILSAAAGIGAVVVAFGLYVGDGLTVVGGLVVLGAALSGLGFEYRDGQPATTLRKHVKSCPGLPIANVWDSDTNRIEAVDPLVGLVTGKLDDVGVVREVLEHLEVCALCAEKLRVVVAFRTGLNGGDFEFSPAKLAALVDRPPKRIQ